MDWQIVINIVALFTSVVGAILGWWVKSIEANQKEFARDLKDLEVKVAEEYPRKSDINGRLDKIDSVLERIFDKLDEKVDK